MWRANKPVDHCPSLSLTTVSHETVIVKTHSLCSVDGCTLPELCSPVCEYKGAHDKHTVQRRCQFLRASGAADIVYTSYEENAVVAVIREALRLSQTPGDHNHGVLVRAVPEVSAVGQSASNSSSERAVQQLEELVRTYKSAIEARMDCKLQTDHPLLHWIVDHAANVYNQYSVSPEGKAPYASLHGKTPKEKLADFGERVLWHVP